jgi:hypothetical protein
MAFVAVASLGLVFGAAVQQLGSASVTLGAWSATAAQVSAPWLILPFLIGSTQRETRRATVLGVIVTVSALFGYYAMTYSPLEIHPWSFDRRDRAARALADRRSAIRPRTRRLELCREIEQRFLVTVSRR